MSCSHYYSTFAQTKENSHLVLLSLTKRKMADMLLYMYSLDVVQTSRVWFENGCVMEHLIKGDAEEDNIQLKCI